EFDLTALKDIDLLPPVDDERNWECHYAAEYVLFGNHCWAGVDTKDVCVDEELGKREAADDGALVNCSGSYVTLHATWKGLQTSRPGLTPSLPRVPPPTSQLAMQVCAMPASRDPDSYPRQLVALHKEIVWLEHLSSLLESGEQLTHIRGGSSASPSDDDLEAQGSHEKEEEEEARWQEALNSMIDRFLEDLVHDSTKQSALISELTQSELPQHSQEHDGGDGMADLFPVLPPRSDLDFTEQVWMLGTQAKSSSDLSEILAAVAETLESGKLRPVVHRSNPSTLAELIQSHLQLSGPTTIESSESELNRINSLFDYWIEEQPLDCFVMVGLYKIHRDLLFYAKDLHRDVQRYLNDLGSFQADAVDQIQGYRCILRVLEVWWLVHQSALGLSEGLLSQITTSVLKHFQNISTIRDQGLNPEAVSQEATDESFGGSYPPPGSAANVNSNGDLFPPDTLLPPAGSDQNGQHSAVHNAGISFAAETGDFNTYEDIIGITVFPPVYSADSHRLAKRVFECFEPHTYQVTVAIPGGSNINSNEDVPASYEGWVPDYAPDAKTKARSDGPTAWWSWLLTQDPSIMDPRSNKDDLDLSGWKDGAERGMADEDSDKGDGNHAAPVTADDVGPRRYSIIEIIRHQ
ncbi:hypothetical protein EV182_002049, partial [Spiromyces aspiralis]